MIDPEMEKLLKHAPELARIGLQRDFLKTPSDLSDAELIERSLDKLPWQDPLTTKMHEYVLNCIFTLLTELPEGHPQYEALCARYILARRRSKSA